MRPLAFDLVGRGAWALVAVGLSVTACQDEAPTGCRCGTGTRCDAGGVCRPVCATDDDCGPCGECRPSGLCYGIAPCRCGEAGDCDDGDACNGAETCDNGWCAAGTPVECPPTGESCFVAVCRTVDQAAECVREPSGACPCAVASECDDQDACNGSERCVNNNCYPGELFTCPPATTPCRVNACVDTDGTPSCVLQLAPLDAACDDGVPCTEAGTCTVLGDCVTTPTVCDDALDCTTDACDPAVDGCVFTPVDATCDDQVDCTIDTCDVALGCRHAPDDGACDDGNGCTDAVCDPLTGDPSTGCTSSANSEQCDDGNPCTVDDVCAAGACGGDPVTDFATLCPGGVCISAVCAVELKGIVTSPAGDCTMDWRGQDLTVVWDSGSQAHRFVGVANVTEETDAGACVADSVHSYFGHVGGGTFTLDLQVNTSTGDGPRLDATTARIAETTVLAYTAMPDARVGRLAGQSVYTSGSLNGQVAGSILGLGRSLARSATGYVFAGRHQSSAEAALVACDLIDVAAGTWDCDANNRLGTTLRPNATVTAVAVAVDGGGVHRGMLAAFVSDDGVATIFDDGPTASGTIESAVSGGGGGGFPDTELGVAVARSWDDIFFAGGGGHISECTSPPNWACVERPSPQEGWDIRDGFVTNAGDLLLVGPFSYRSPIGVMVSGSRLAVLPAGRAADIATNWVTLPLAATMDDRALAVAVGGAKLQVLGYRRAISGGDRLVVWSYEAQ